MGVFFIISFDPLQQLLGFGLVYFAGGNDAGFAGADEGIGQALGLFARANHAEVDHVTGRQVTDALGAGSAEYKAGHNHEARCGDSALAEEIPARGRCRFFIGHAY